MAYMFLYIAYHGKIPGFGKIYYMIYCGDSMGNNVKTTMKTIKKVFLESAYLKSKFEDWTLNTDSVEFIRKPQTKREIENKVRHMEAGGKETEDKLLDVCDVELDWYIPSNFAIEFILFIRLALGEEPENSNPKAH